TTTPKDMTEFLLQVQLKLTSFVLSEWLEVFGDVEADHWFSIFLNELRLKDYQSTNEDIVYNDITRVNPNATFDSFDISPRIHPNKDLSDLNINESDLIDISSHLNSPYSAQKDRPNIVINTSSNDC